MWDAWRSAAIFLAVTTAIVLACTAGQAGAQPPVARPQPPPTAQGTNTATPAPGANTPGTTATQPRVTAGTPASTAGRPAPAATTPPVAASSPAPSLAKTAAATASTKEQVPTETTLGVPVMPNATFIGSYDAGSAGQRFYLYGTTLPFADVVLYYRTVLKQKGELVFEIPATHMFEVGKYREDEVAFPPGVTVKDYAVGGMPGLANPKLGATPSAFPTVIQIVPAGVPPTARPR
jgi:hypothetical protein